MWESSDDSIVSVNNDDEIEALSEGTAIIKLNTNNDISGEVVVNVINNSVIISPREYQMYVGDNFKISTNKE